MSEGDWISLIGTGLQALSSWNSGQNQQDAYDDQAEYLRKQAEHNAEISLLDARAAEKDAVAAEISYGWKLKRHLQDVGNMVGKARTDFSKSGVAMEGSALDAVVETARAGAEDAALIINEGKTAYQRGMEIGRRYRLLSKYGLRDAAYQASMLENAGDDAATAGTLTGLGQFFQSLSETGDSQGWWE